jgi:hypothetical protein
MRSAALRLPVLRALAAVIAGWSDDALERVFGNRAALWLLFKGMASAYQPQVVPGFRGSIAFRVERPHTDGGHCEWTIDVFDSAAHASAGTPPTGQADLQVTASAAELIRVVAGLTDPGEPIITGQFDVSDYRLGSMVAEMFGSPPLSGE